jgi:hypothetical protein
MKKYMINVVWLFTASVFTACSDYFDVIDPDELSAGTVFKTETDMNLALNHLYTHLPNADIESTDIVPYFWTDDAIHRNINNAGGRQGSDYVWTTTLPPLNIFYRYDDIADINYFLEALPNAEYASDELRNRHGAEARFIRAWLYERMLFAYGDVALITKVIFPTDLPSRDSREEVFNFVIGELEQIEDILPSTYDGVDAGRISKGAVLALKARAYLNALGWNSDVAGMYKGAEDACKAIIDSGIYNLSPGIEGFKALFTTATDLQTGGEIILSNIYVPDFRTHELTRQIAQKGSWRGPEAGYGNNQSRPGFTAAFIDEVQTINGLFPKDDPLYNPMNPKRNRDPRLTATVVFQGDSLPAKGNPEDIYVYEPHPAIGNNIDDITRPSNATGYGFRKYLTYDLPALNQAESDFKIIRYSEVLLMYAETLAGRGADSDALIYLNMVRERVGMPAYGAELELPTITRGTTGNQMIDAILLERRYEFAGEGPQRWFDIWRYRLGDQVIGQVYGIPESTTLLGDLDGPKFKPNGDAYHRVWEERFYLLPINIRTIDLNPNITQNPGWVGG